MRVNNLQPDPSNKFLILMYRTATKLVDRWEIGPPTIQQYDLATHQFTRTIPWPKGDEREIGRTCGSARTASTCSSSATR